MADNRELLRMLAKEAAAFADADDGRTVTVESSGVKKPSAKYMITLCEYPDIIVTRQSPRMTKHLILMPSTGTAFIRTEDKKGTTSELLNEKNYVSFAAEMPEIEIPGWFWIKTIRRGVEAGRLILDIFNDEEILEMIRKKVLPKDVDLMRYGCFSEIRRISSAYKEYPQLVAGNIDRKKSLKILVYEQCFCKDIVRMFGLQNARDFFDAYETSLMRLDNTKEYYNAMSGRLARAHTHEWETRNDAGEYWISKIPACKMKYESFKEYVLYDSYRMGYGISAENFFNEWLDTLDMQHQIYGKIRNKYPTDLPLLHHQLSFKQTIMEEAIDEKKFAEQAEKAAAYEGNYRGFTFIAPKCRQDFIDEAGMQSNCLAGYIGTFTNGECIIIFMRKKYDPEYSYITLEIIDGKVVQAKLRSNRDPSVEEHTIAANWVELCNKKALEKALAG